MGKLFIADKAECTCKYGSAPAKLKVLSHSKTNINGNKKIATSQELGNCFHAPFGTCSFSYPRRPCSVSVTKWSGLYQKMRINLNSYPLLPESKATCAVAGSECIEIAEAGQEEIPGEAHLNNSSREHMNDLDPTANFDQNESYTRVITYIRE